MKAVSLAVNQAAVVLAVIVLAGCNYQVKKTTSDGAGGGETKAAATISFDMVHSQVLEKHCSECHDNFDAYADITTSNIINKGSASTSELYTRLKNNGGDMPKGHPQIADADAQLIRDWIDSGAPEFVGNASSPIAAPVPAPADPSSPQPIPVQPAPEPQQPAPVQPAPAPSQPAPVQPAPQPEPQPSPSSNPATLISATYTDLNARVFSQKCTACHSDAKNVAGFSLEHYAGIVNNARLVDHVKPEESGLIQSVEDDFMPPKRAVTAGMVSVLTPEEKSALKVWIQAGAPQN